MHERHPDYLAKLCCKGSSTLRCPEGLGSGFFRFDDQRKFDCDYCTPLEKGIFLFLGSESFSGFRVSGAVRFEFLEGSKKVTMQIHDKFGRIAR